jgi:hypothetical protein
VSPRATLSRHPGFAATFRNALAPSLRINPPRARTPHERAWCAAGADSAGPSA